MNIDEIKLQLPEDTRLPKFRALADLLGNWIVANKPEAGTRLPSERLLADSWGVSPATVAKTLDILVQKGLLMRRSGSGTYISGKSTTAGFSRVGIVAHEPIINDDCYVTAVLQEFYSYWSKRNVDIISLIRTPDQYEQAIREYRLAGILVLCPQKHFTPQILELIRKKIPIVTVGVCLDGLDGYSFGTDHRKVCEKAVAYLHKLGHTKIGITTGSNSSGMREREEGYRQGMWQAKLPINPSWIIQIQYQESYEDLLERLLKDGDMPTALLLSDFSRLAKLYNACRKLEVKIPDDLSVVAFDDPAFMAELDPPVTVFAQPVREITRMATEQLERLILHQNPMTSSPSDAILIERGSCKKRVRKSKNKAQEIVS